MDPNALPIDTRRTGADGSPVSRHHRAASPQTDAVLVGSPRPSARLVRPGRRARVVVALAAGLAATLLAVPASAQVGGPLGPSTTEDDDLPSTTTAPEATTTAPATTSSAPSTATTPEPDGDAEPDADAVLAQTDDSSNGLLVAVGAVVGGLALLVVGLLVGLALGRRRSPGQAPQPVRQVAPIPSPVPAPPNGGHPIDPAPDRDADRIRSQREALVGGLIDLADRLPSEALRDEALRTLAAGGVTAVWPDGEAFDPAVHRAVAQVAAPEGAVHDTVASTERPGFRDGPHLRRAPEVVVQRIGEHP